ncbi:MAG: F0F1 ATP synthase subunit delta [Bifidobacterium pseudocatenulatum]
MRGEASRIADRVSRDSLAPKLRDSGEDAWRIGNELFTITSALDHNIQLERALTDPSRPVEDKVAVVKTLIGDQAHPLVMEIMSDLVSRRWSRVSDIANAVEDFGVDGMMYYADYTNTTLQVSIELAELHSALLNLPVVRTKLYDATVSSEARVKLLYSLIGDADFTKVTKRLAEHATCNLRNRRYLQTIQWLINKFSRHMGESMVTVTTATPLSKEQVEKLIAIYSAKTGHPVHINSVVDPTVMGGMRIQVGDEVTDNTVVATRTSAHGEGNRLTVRRRNKPETRLD